MLFWLLVCLAFLFGMFVVIVFSLVWKEAYNKMLIVPPTSTNKASVKCPVCGNDIIIEVTKP